MKPFNLVRTFFTFSFKLMEYRKITLEELENRPLRSSEKVNENYH